MSDTKYTPEQIKKAFELAAAVDVVAYSRTYLGYIWNSKGFALCPFHIEKTPSLSYFKKANKARCFGGCGNFSIIDLTMEFHKIDNTTAALLICEDLGLDFEN